MINKFSKNSIDGFLNIRSMMEMNYNTIDFYFQEIQKLIKKNGLFACFNRFHKKQEMKLLVLKNTHLTIHGKWFFQKNLLFNQMLTC